MKKRGVSPVIATILLIALVTAAAAIVFLVVIPMLNPAPEAIVKTISTTQDNGNYTVVFTILAQGGDIVFNGTVDPSPDVAYLNVVTAAGLEIKNGIQKQITIIGSFTVGESYTFNIYFTAGDSDIIGVGVKII
ncbi:MAG: type IV pilin [Candidatus Heimdallarchaeota archaeon]|nr:type IV pilin [Candidatus Heimdallarchaeota archaeon]MCK4876846.1 type IV pilin [Candidatus Heimdallarchaeota archaeon]